MASLFLGVIGGVIGGAPGAAIGSLIGSAFDTLVLIPAISPTQTAKGTRVETLKLSQATEGAPIWTAIGPRNRHPGQIIWQTDLKPTKVVESVGGKGGPSTNQERFIYHVSFAVAFADAQHFSISKIRKIIAFGGKVLYDGTPSSPRYTSLSIYHGDQLTPDPVMQAELGVGKVPLYKQTCFAVFELLDVTDFGNQIPDLNAFIEQDVDMSLASAIDGLLERAGLTTAQYDVTRLPFCLRGYSIPEPQKTTDTLAPLLIGFGVAVQESNGKIVFFPQGGEEEVRVPLTDLGTYDSKGDDDAPHKLRFTDPLDISVPGIVHVKYVNNEDDLQPGSEPAEHSEQTNPGNMTANVAVTMNSDEAHAAGRRILWSYEMERQQIQLSLPPNYIHIQEHDALLVTDEDGVTHRIIVGSVDRGNNYVIQVTGRASCAAVFSQAGDGAGPGQGGSAAYIPPDTIGFVLDCPALIEEHIAFVGAYFVVCREDEDDLWNGAAAFSSVDNSTYVKRADLDAEAVIGMTTIGLGPAEPDSWDRSSVLEVELFGGSLSSVTEDQCLAGENRFAVRTPSGEWEILGAATVTQTGPLQYQLRNLLRGFRGTEHLIGLHAAAGSPFIKLVNDGSINFWNRGSAGLGTNDYYKFPAVGGVVSEYPEQRIPLNGLTMRPLSPVHLLGQRGPDIVLYGVDIAASATQAAYTSTTPDRFKGIEVGQPINTDGFSNGGNNGDSVVTGKPNNQTLVVNRTLTTEAAGATVTLLRGGDDDTTIRWTRRTKRFASAFSIQDPAPLTSDETPEQYQIEFRRGGMDTAPVRTVATGVTSHVYTAAERAADGLDTDSDINVSVYQMSTVAGRSVPATRRING